MTIKSNTMQEWKKNYFKVNDTVAIKIDKVDKTLPLHPNVLIGKGLQVENNYTKVVTRQGIISTFISTNRLNKINAQLEIMFLITPRKLPFHQLARKKWITNEKISNIVRVQFTVTLQDNLLIKRYNPLLLFLVCFNVNESISLL